MVSITLRVLSRPDTTHLSKIYQNLGLDYDERVLPSIGNEVLKSIVAQFDAAELITQREVVGAVLYLHIHIYVRNYIDRCLRAFGRIYLHVQGNSISSLKMSPSHISLSERYDLSMPQLNHLLITLPVRNLRKP
jgi:hypothetical protein